MYRLIKYNNEFPDCLILLTSSKWIPFDENNIDYQEYLKWVEEGNVPEEINLGGI
jgi:hypothetical protein